MNIHVGQQDRSTGLLGQPMMPDIYLSQTQLLAVEFLERSLRDLESLVAVTGSSGTGKTVALNSLLTQRETAGDRILRVNNFVAGPLSLHRVLASSLGVTDAGDLSAEALEPVLRRALVAAGQSDPPVLAVDDAQSLLPETLRYLCLLAGLRDAGRPLLRILLVGRPGFAIRQSMPRQFTLEAMAPDDTRRLVLHGFKLAGVPAPDETVQDVVQKAQGNLRKLDLLLGPSIEGARTEGRRRLTPRALQAATRPRRQGRTAGRSLGPWLALPALLVAGAAGVAIAYHDGLLGSVAEVRPVGEVAPPAPVAAVVPTTAAAPAVIVPPIATPPVATASTPVRHPDPVAAPPQPPGTSQAALPAPVPAAAAPLPPAPLQTATVEPSRAAPPPAPVPSPPPVAPAANRAAAHFRVYNISACHQGVCPRWSVTDLDQRQRFVAAFNPASLHLDRDTLQRLREGSLDLVVSGSVAQNGSDGRTLYAEALQQVAPHHGRPHAASSASEPIELAPSQVGSPPLQSPQIQSPQPGFLPIPPPAQ